MGRPRKDAELENGENVETETAQLNPNPQVSEAEKNAWIAKEKAHVKRWVKDGELAEQIAQRNWENRKAVDALRKR